MAGEGSEEIRQLREQLAAARTEAQTLQGELASARESVTDLEAQLRTVRLEAEVEKLRAMEQVRQQSDQERQLLRMDKDKECQRLTEQNDQLQSVNQGLRREIESLEERLQEAPSEPGSHVAEQDDRQLVSHASPHSADNSVHVGSQTVGEGGESAPSPLPVTLAEEQTADAPIVGGQPPMIGPMDGQNMRESPTSVVSVEGPDGHPTSPSMLQQVTQLLQAQRDMMAAQIEAIATNSVPPLHLFRGNDVHTEDGSFDRWLEQFEDRMKVANWNDNQKLFQLKSHLEKTAAHVVRMMPSEERAKYTFVVSTLRKRFQSLDIEELKGLEFHQLMQDKQSVEELGVVLQKLARKAFPESRAKEFDRMLKGRFYQALLPKWQRKLGAPKTDESFEDLYARARAIERHDQQIGAGRQADSRLHKPSTADESSKKTDTASEPKTGKNWHGQPRRDDRNRSRSCFHCGEVGHIQRNW